MFLLFYCVISSLTAPSTGSGSPSTQPSSGGVIPPSITDIFGIPESTVVDTSGGAGGSTGAVSPQGPGSSTQGGGVVSPGAAGNSNESRKKGIK